MLRLTEFSKEKYIFFVSLQFKWKLSFVPREIVKHNTLHHRRAVSLLRCKYLFIKVCKCTISLNKTIIDLEQSLEKHCLTISYNYSLLSRYHRLPYDYCITTDACLFYLIYMYDAGYDAITVVLKGFALLFQECTSAIVEIKNWLITIRLKCLDSTKSFSSILLFQWKL